MSFQLRDVLSNPDSFPALLLQTAMKTLGTQADIICGAPHNMNETDGKLHIYVDMPGIEPKNVKVHFSTNKMSAIGSREKPGNVVDPGLVKYGEIKMDISLPFSVTNKESVQIQVSNGVLHVTIDREKEEVNNFTVKCS